MREVTDFRLTLNLFSENICTGKTQLLILFSQSTMKFFNNLH